MERGVRMGMMDGGMYVEPAPLLARAPLLTFAYVSDACPSVAGSQMHLLPICTPCPLFSPTTTCTAYLYRGRPRAEGEGGVDTRVLKGGMGGLCERATRRGQESRTRVQTPA
jgi:hypothetical protein